MPTEQVVAFPERYTSVYLHPLKTHLLIVNEIAPVPIVINWYRAKTSAIVCTFLKKVVFLRLFFGRSPLPMVAGAWQGTWHNEEAFTWRLFLAHWNLANSIIEVKNRAEVDVLCGIWVFIMTIWLWWYHIRRGLLRCSFFLNGQC